MKLFECQHCGQLLYFENTRCERCGHVLGYLPDRENLATITGDGCGRWHALGDAEAAFGFCSNTAYDVCSWLVPADAPETHCRACQLNRTTPTSMNQRIYFFGDVWKLPNTALSLGCCGIVCP
jgi:hypothetical protein